MQRRWHATRPHGRSCNRPPKRWAFWKNALCSRRPPGSWRSPRPLLGLSLLGKIQPIVLRHGEYPRPIARAGPMQLRKVDLGGFCSENDTWCFSYRGRCTQNFVSPEVLNISFCRHCMALYRAERSACRRLFLGSLPLHHAP